MIGIRPFRIRRAVLGLAILMLGAAAASAQSVPAGPIQTVFAEFDRVCGQVADRDAYVAAAPGAGWTAYEPEAGTSMRRIIDLGGQMVREATAEMGQPDAVRYENAAFRKSVNGRDLIMLVSLIGVPGLQPSIECRVYDLTAAEPSDAEIAAWTQVPPTSRERGDGVALIEWEPSFREGFSRIAVIHVDPSSPVRAQIPALGLVIMSIQGLPSA